MCINAIIHKNWSWHYWNPQLKISESINFYVLLPDKNDPLFISGNNGSCVLLIKWRDQQILLTGDIEKKAEQALLARYRIEPDNLLVAPHPRVVKRPLARRLSLILNLSMWSFPLVIAIIMVIHIPL